MKISKKRLKQIIAEELNLLEVEEPKKKKPKKAGPVSIQGLIDNLFPLLSGVTLSDAEIKMFHDLMKAMAKAGNDRDIAADPGVQRQYDKLMSVLRKKPEGEE